MSRNTNNKEDSRDIVVDIHEQTKAFDAKSIPITSVP